MTTSLDSPWTAAALAAEFTAARGRTLALFERLQRAIGPDTYPRYLPELSPPLWDLGHLAWYEGFWIARNPGLMAGDGDNAITARAPVALLPKADVWFDDRRVNHPARWHQPLPGVAPIADWARRTREQTLVLLQAAARREAALALFTRVLDAEDRLHEEWLAIAQTLGIDPGAAADDPDESPVADTGAAAIDAAPVSWARYLPFVDAGGYEQREFWSDEGWDWRKRLGLVRPRHLGAPEAGDDTPLQRARFGRWVPLDRALPAMHLSWHEAQAWCRWAGRRLPRAAEWRGAQDGDDAFHWGQVWEWVASDEPDGAPGLIGASFATAPRLRQQPASMCRAADRNDGFCGFRSCPLDAA
ncbi:SUMF1/EgtB/PvdO family nonheme iron enzyme [Ideonella sp.]|uniref:SUMF1/EgtB/PvdO family nonheme iron enzyme n=1 Tax=Ideonella sp. TaxID=1929293 RepID=UPI002B47064D|nr:SUMF1/EgtB/PvdO family nonheme iron enzyme [Ideonella sp.]HJV71054.1 SUMF1/EgtB/PvdO family nonheme iron enzyme [Ideonella sp.]